MPPEEIDTEITAYRREKNKKSKAYK